MAHYSSTTGELSQRLRFSTPASLLWIPYHLLRKTWSIGNGSTSTHTYIHKLDNDSLLNIFYFCRPAAPSFLGENEVDIIKILGGGNWSHERWWYSLVKVCRRWRHLVLESASLLGLSLLCTYGTPVADMLANYPPLPLIIDYHVLYDELTADDELGITLALWRCDRVRWIRLLQPIPVMERLLMILQGEFPNLEYLIVERHPSEDSNIVYTPKTFRAPRLRYIVAMGLSIPTDTGGNPVVLKLRFTRGDYFYPNVLLQPCLVERHQELPSIPTYLVTTLKDNCCKQQSRGASPPYFRCFGFQGTNR
jgi:hypothetical protein